MQKSGHVYTRRFLKFRKSYATKLGQLRHTSRFIAIEQAMQSVFVPVCVFVCVYVCERVCVLVSLPPRLSTSTCLLAPRRKLPGSRNTCEHAHMQF